MKPYQVLFLCTGNSARSIIAEGLLNHLGRGRFHAYSAGSQPTGVVHPETIALLESLELRTAEFRSKSWNEFARPGAPSLDFVFTVCDNAAGEVCPHWPGQPMTAHWGVEDPAAFVGAPSEQRRQFERVAMMLRRRIDLFLALPLESIESLALMNTIREIGTR